MAGDATTMEPNRAEDFADTRTLILRTAEAMFLKHGYAAVSMNNLVEEVSKTRKLSKPAIYYHFADKEALFVAVVRALTERTGREIEAAANSDGDVRTRVHAVIGVMRRSHTKDFPRMFADAGEHLREALHEQFGEILRENILAPLIRCFARIAQKGGLREGVAPPVATMAAVGLVAGFSLGAAEFAPPLMGMVPEGDLTDTITDLLLHGIAASG